MNFGRVMNVAKGTWGTATIYSHDSEKSQLTLIPEPQPTKHSVAPVNHRHQSQKIINVLENQTDENFQRTEGLAEPLAFLSSSLFCTLLEDTVTQMRILEQCSNELKIIKTLADLPNLTVRKFNVKMPEVDELEGIDRNNLHCTIYKVRKLDADRKHVNTIMQNAYLELALHRTYYVLTDNIRQMITRNNYWRFLQLEEAKNKTTRRELIKQLRMQRNSIKSALYETNSNIADLKTKVEDSALCFEAGSRYTDKWEVARTEQHIQGISYTESVPLATIMYFKQRLEHEQRVHSEVELLVNIVINETLVKVEDWMDKYDHDMEKIDLKIQVKKNDYQMMLDRRLEMEETLEVRAVVMQAWIDFKDKREKARLYREKMTKAATIVQAWWRGLLVRLQLGPYKVKKGDKKGKK